MKIISGKFVFASLIFLIVLTFIVNNLITKNTFLKKNNISENNIKENDKIIGVQILQQNKKGDKFLIIADTLEEKNSKEKKITLENSLTTINQKGILTKISAGKAMITNDYNNFVFTNKVKITKKTRKFTLKTQTLSGAFDKGNYHTNDNVDIVSGNTRIKGKGLNIKKNGEYIKIKGKAVLKMLLSNKNAH